MHRHPQSPNARLAGAICLLAALLGSGAAAYAGGILYFADIHNPTANDGFIRSVNSDGFSLQDILNVGAGLRGMAFDENTAYVYWTDINAQKISRMFLGNPTPEDIVTGLNTPVSVAVAPNNGLLFWGDTGTNQIGIALLDGSNAQPLISTPFGSDLIVLGFLRKIYWTTSDSPTTGRILRSDYSGSVVETVIEGLGKPAHLAIDPINSKIYWTDQTLLAVRSANLDGTGVQTLYTAGAGAQLDGIALDLTAVTNGRVFWGQGAAGGSAGNIMQVNSGGANLRTVLSGIGLVQEIVFAPHLLGDMNCDNAVNFGDINSFVLALSDPNGYHTAMAGCDLMNGDINGDGNFDFGDINPFVALLSGGS